LYTEVSRGAAVSHAQQRFAAFVALWRCFSRFFYFYAATRAAARAVAMSPFCHALRGLRAQPFCLLPSVCLMSLIGVYERPAITCPWFTRPPSAQPCFCTYQCHMVAATGAATMLPLPRVPTLFQRHAPRPPKGTSCPACHIREVRRRPRDRHVGRRPPVGAVQKRVAV